MPLQVQACVALRTRHVKLGTSLAVQAQASRRRVGVAASTDTAEHCCGTAIESMRAVRVCNRRPRQCMYVCMGLAELVILPC